MKPALSPHDDGVLAELARQRPRRRATTSGSVTTVRMTSTNFCTGAGLKKCMPITRPGCDVRGRDLGDRQRRGVGGEHRRPGATISSSCWKIVRLSRSCSTTASTTRSQSLRSSIEVVSVSRLEELALLGLAQLAALDRAAGGVLEVLAAALARASSFCSTPITAKPLRAKTSAMPAPIVPRPTTPMVRNSRGIAGGAGHARHHRTGYSRAADGISRHRWFDGAGTSSTTAGRLPTS